MIKKPCIFCNKLYEVDHNVYLKIDEDSMLFIPSKEDYVVELPCLIEYLVPISTLRKQLKKKLDLSKKKETKG